MLRLPVLLLATAAAGGLIFGSSAAVPQQGVRILYGSEWAGPAEIYAVDPFVSVDREGVGALMRMAVELGRQTRGTLKLGICGEQGGDPSSVEFCHMIGLDYVSCSPYRLPIARLSAAQAVLRGKA